LGAEDGGCTTVAVAVAVAVGVRVGVGEGGFLIVVVQRAIASFRLNPAFTAFIKQLRRSSVHIAVRIGS